MLSWASLAKQSLYYVNVVISFYSPSCSVPLEDHRNDLGLYWAIYLLPLFRNNSIPIEFLIMPKRNLKPADLTHFLKWASLNGISLDSTPISSEVDFVNYSRVKWRI